MENEDTLNKLAVVSRKDYKDANLDECLTDLCMSHTIGEVVSLREHARNNRHLLGSSIIFDAIFDGPDMGLINHIVKRIDGLVPEDKKRESYANLMGDAINEVLDLPREKVARIEPEDSAITALAKAVIHLATQQTGKNYQAKRAKADAVAMILERTGGRKVEPVKPRLEEKYVDPDWMTLTDGECDV